MNFNLFVGCGRLTNDAELKYTKATNMAMTKLRLAINDRRDDSVLFIDALVFGKMAESLVEYLKKGTVVCVQGKLKADEYESQDGHKVKSVCLMVDELTLGPKS